MNQGVQDRVLGWDLGTERQATEERLQTALRHLDLLVSRRKLKTGPRARIETVLRTSPLSGIYAEWLLSEEPEEFRDGLQHNQDFRREARIYGMSNGKLQAWKEGISDKGVKVRFAKNDFLGVEDIISQAARFVSLYNRLQDALDSPREMLRASAEGVQVLAAPAFSTSDNLKEQGVYLDHVDALFQHVAEMYIGIKDERLQFHLWGITDVDPEAGEDYQMYRGIEELPREHLLYFDDEGMRESVLSYLKQRRLDGERYDSAMIRLYEVYDQLQGVLESNSREQTERAVLEANVHLTKMTNQAFVRDLEQAVIEDLTHSLRENEMHVLTIADLLPALQRSSTKQQRFVSEMLDTYADRLLETTEDLQIANTYGELPGVHSLRALSQEATNLRHHLHGLEEPKRAAQKVWGKPSARYFCEVEKPDPLDVNIGGDSGSCYIVKKWDGTVEIKEVESMGKFIPYHLLDEGTKMIGIYQTIGEQTRRVGMVFAHATINSTGQQAPYPPEDQPREDSDQLVLLMNSEELSTSMNPLSQAGLDRLTNHVNGFLQQYAMACGFSREAMGSEEFNTGYNHTLPESMEDKGTDMLLKVPQVGGALFHSDVLQTGPTEKGRATGITNAGWKYLKRGR